jgi:hypothetical protein
MEKQFASGDGNKARTRSARVQSELDRLDGEIMRAAARVNASERMRQFTKLYHDLLGTRMLLRYFECGRCRDEGGRRK